MSRAVDFTGGYSTSSGAHAQAVSDRVKNAGIRIPAGLSQVSTAPPVIGAIIPIPKGIRLI